MKLFPSQNEQVITTIIVTFVSGLIVGLMTHLSKTEVTVGILTLLAAFLGAHYAFTLNARRANQELIDQKRAEGNLTIFNISRLYNSFLSIKRQFIEPHRESEAKHFEIQPSYEFGIDVNFNFDKLAFLFNSNNPNVLGELNTLHNQVSTTLNLMKQRSAIHTGEFQPKLEAANLSVAEFQLAKIEEVAGVRLTNTLRTATEDMIEAVDDIVFRSEKVANDLNKALIDSLGARGILKLKPVENI